MTDTTNLPRMPWPTAPVDNPEAGSDDPTTGWGEEAVPELPTQASASIPGHSLEA